jgi:prepilin-type N-terminal cleavage/methylation domain-containing protein
MSTATAPHLRAGFSLVELLVALTLLGVGATGLAMTLAGDRRVRDLAVAHSRAAERARARLESLAGHPCGADTAGTSTAPWGAESWRATAANGSWRLTDAFLLRGSSRPLVIEARVACPD